MKIIEQLKILDDLIVEHTTPPAKAKLRNYLSTIIEQAETEGDLPDKMQALQAQCNQLKEELAQFKQVPTAKAVQRRMSERERQVRHL